MDFWDDPEIAQRVRDKALEINQCGKETNVKEFLAATSIVLGALMGTVYPKDKWEEVTQFVKETMERIAAEPKTKALN